MFMRLHEDLVVRISVALRMSEKHLPSLEVYVNRLSNDLLRIIIVGGHNFKQLL